MAHVEIKKSIQEIQNNTVPIKGLNNFEMRNPDLYWTLGSNLVSYFRSKQVDEKSWLLYSQKLFKNYEIEIRQNGNTWKHPRKGNPPKRTWVELCLSFALHFQDKKRWDKVANLSGHMFKVNGKSQFTQRYAEDLLKYYSKKNLIPDAEKKQSLFESEINKFEKKPTLTEFRNIARRIFGDSQVLTTIENIETLTRQINNVMDIAIKREKLRKSIGSDAIHNFRILLQLMLLATDIDKMSKYKKKAKLPKTIQTNNDTINSLYHDILNITNDIKHTNRLQKISSEIRQLECCLKAICSDSDYEEYAKDLKLLQSLFA